MTDSTPGDFKLCHRCCRVAPQEFRFCPRCGGNSWDDVPHQIARPSDVGYKEVGQLGITPWTAGDVAKGLLFFVAQAIVISALFIMVILLLDEDNLEVYALLVTFLVEGMLVVSVWLFAVSKYRIRWSALGFWRRPNVRDVVLAVGVLLVGIAVQAGYFAVMDLLGVDISGASSSTFLEESGTVLVLLGILALLVAPLTEELFFRGFVFGGLANRFGFRWAALGSGAAFSIAHIEPIKLLPLFVLGVLFAWIYYKTGSLWAPMLAHFLNNAIALVVLFV